VLSEELLVDEKLIKFTIKLFEDVSSVLHKILLVNPEGSVWTASD
jgi:hypothetical protein